MSTKEMKGMIKQMGELVDKMKDMAQFDAAKNTAENEGMPDQVPKSQKNPKVPLIVAVLKRKRG